MARLSLGVPCTSGKENESRLPIHPQHLERIDEDLRASIYLEHGYGAQYGVPDEVLKAQVAGLRTRAELLAESDVVLLPKPVLSDLEQMHEGQVLWGWPHAVQDADLAQAAIDRRLTLVAWEAMNHWSPSGRFVLHVFNLNNELAGYASVLHALTLTGSTGSYGRPLTAAVLGFGNAARGAVTALHALGVHDVTVLTLRDTMAVASPIPSVVMEQLERVDDDSGRTLVVTREESVPTAEFLAHHDIVVNCALQDTDAPLMFVTNDELALFAPGTLLVDVSCDAGMGFEFADPTPLSAPTFTVGDGVTYYGADHSPGVLWRSATWGISEAVLPFLRSVMDGPTAWDDDPTIARAIEIRDGVVVNPKILAFQGRSATWPHPVAG
ncbi:N(5)-(carboxyethyl)ornithine synthase [Cellulomonas sp. PhB150]|uniref:N(5)-(carboxyethyl)ornithine synthase n=1 Tax=Cellulomonas sp. PhB150 TaxID=2485188 RepID=UPI000F4909B9|nr:N(5)-(carboxyethyl)ornithine synthase [Cellulomonas sp. PhB150]ROS27773.1 alanine dehydrogenase [Cellulomonas sp. PhB150]